MDGGGRVAEPLNRPDIPAGRGGARAARKPASVPARAPARKSASRPSLQRRAAGARASAAWLATLERWLDLRAMQVAALRLPRRAGFLASLLILAASLGYGMVAGGHAPAVLTALKDARDSAANAAGFNISGIALTGQKHLSREEVLAIAGITGRNSLLFLDVGDVRARLLANPWIAEATVQKLYPDRLQLQVTEREAFALWQKSGRVSVVAADGTVLETYVSRRFTGLPLVVGEGAQIQAKAFLAMLDGFPQIRGSMRAAMLVAERRWTVRLRSGVDVRLPETDADKALAQLVALDRDKKILSRDIASVDMRLPDRVTLRLSDAAAEAREELLKPKKAKPKGGAA